MVLRPLLAGAACLLLAGCSFSSLHPAVDATAPGVAMKKDLVIDERHARLGCGLDAVVAAHEYFHPNADEVQLSDRMRGHLADGSTPVELLLGAREAGLTASIHRGTPETLAQMATDPEVVPVVMMDASLGPQDIMRLRQLGIPSLPDPATQDQPHWLVVAGVDDDKFVVCGEGRKQYQLPLTILEPRWEKYDYCLIELRR